MQSAAKPSLPLPLYYPSFAGRLFIAARTTPSTVAAASVCRFGNKCDGISIVTEIDDWPNRLWMYAIGGYWLASSAIPLLKSTFGSQPNSFRNREESAVM